MLILLALFIDFLAASFFSSWIIHTVLGYLLARIVLPVEHTPWGVIFIASTAFMVTDFAAHGVFGLGLLYLIPTMLVLLRLKVMLAQGATWLIFLGFCLFFIYESALCGAHVTIVQIISNLVVGYLTLLGLRGNRAPRPRASGMRKVWTPSRRDAS